MGFPTIFLRIPDFDLPTQEIEAREGSDSSSITEKGLSVLQSLWQGISGLCQGISSRSWSMISPSDNCQVSTIFQKIFSCGQSRAEQEEEEFDYNITTSSGYLLINFVSHFEPESSDESDRHFFDLPPFDPSKLQSLN